MKISNIKVELPFKIGDIIVPKGYINKYLIQDIIINSTYYCKTKDLKNNIIFRLLDIESQAPFLFNYNDFEWLKYKIERN